MTINFCFSEHNRLSNLVDKIVCIFSLTIILNKLQEFPPASKLDPKVYGDQSSTIRKEDIESNLDGLTIDEAIFKFDMIFCFDNNFFLFLITRGVKFRFNQINITKSRLSSTHPNKHDSFHFND